MTWALCLNCGEVKFGAICPCPRCGVASTGNMDLDIAFSDHHVAKATLEQLGQVVAALHEASSDDKLCFWSFIRYMSVTHPSILQVNLKPDAEQQCDALLQRVTLPEVTLRTASRNALSGNPKERQKRPWWKFWKFRNGHSHSKDE